MQCRYCNAKVYVSHICLHCNEHYCLEHQEPNTHNCLYHEQPHQLPANQKQPTIKLEEPQKPLSTTGNLLKKLFPATFMLVVLEEVLRQISYARSSPLFEPNIYVAMLSQWITPYIASSIIFLSVCGILLTVNKFASKNEDTSSNPQIRLLRKAVPLGIYAIIIAVYASTTIQWLLILSA
jgi:hypothetical protein